VSHYYSFCLLTQSFPDLTSLPSDERLGFTSPPSRTCLPETLKKGFMFSGFRYLVDLSSTRPLKSSLSTRLSERPPSIVPCCVWPDGRVKGQLCTRAHVVFFPLFRVSCCCRTDASDLALARRVHLAPFSLSLRPVLANTCSLPSGPRGNHKSVLFLRGKAFPHLWHWD